ncbi:MAG: hypothetical protein QXU88_02610 [Candidatus Woesearchaeota archaeon]
MSNKTIGVLIVLLLAIALFGTVVWISKSTKSGSSASGLYHGYSSYEEMMEVHHGKSANSAASVSTGATTGVGGCGIEPTSHDASPQGSGEMSEYGISYDSAGYAKLIDYAKSIKLNSEQTKKIVGLDVRLPCCGFTTLQASNNCECGHHVALYGLAKLLVTKGYTREQIQAEINKWKEVFYPGGADSGTGGC